MPREESGEHLVVHERDGALVWQTRIEEELRHLESRVAEVERQSRSLEATMHELTRAIATIGGKIDVIQTEALEAQRERRERERQSYERAVAIEDRDAKLAHARRMRWIAAWAPTIAAVGAAIAGVIAASK